ncbi:MAG: DNA recombination protein RmuC, partial [Myxococcota bacterium]|nr:DNA recombination protein RmuC [Myxococcota bacterium]
MLILSIFLAGTLVGAGLVWIFLKQRTRAQNAALDERLKHKDETIERLEKQNTEDLEKMSASQEALDTLRQTCATYEERNQRLGELEDGLKNKDEALEEAQAELATSKAKIAKLDTQIQADKTNHEEKLRLLAEAKENLSEQFQNLANKIFETKAKTFGEQSKENLSAMLNPFREQMKDFKQKVEEVYVNEAKDRSALKSQVEQLQELNQRISQDAVNLTNALKGESKTQGSWGELILERILEESGLQEGREYELEKSVTLESGKRFRPDVVVHLPEGKDVVIDSKVSLTSYEAYCSAETDEDK